MLWGSINIYNEASLGKLQQEWAARRLAAEQEAKEYNELCATKAELVEKLSQNTLEQDKLYKYLVGIKMNMTLPRLELRLLRTTQ